MFTQLPHSRQGRYSVTGVTARDDGTYTLTKVLKTWGNEGRHEHAMANQAHQAAPWCCLEFTYTDDPQCIPDDSGAEALSCVYVDKPVGCQYHDMFTMLKSNATDETISSIIIQVLGCLSALSVRHITHNDMHVANVLLRSCDHTHVVYVTGPQEDVVACVPTHGIEPVIIDFGLSSAKMPGRRTMSTDHLTHIGVSQSTHIMDTRYDTCVFLMNVDFVHQQMPDRTDIVPYQCLISTVPTQDSRPHTDRLRSINNELQRSMPIMRRGLQVDVLLDMLYVLRATVPIRIHHLQKTKLQAAWADLLSTGSEHGGSQWELVDMLRVACIKKCPQPLMPLAKLAASVSYNVNSHNARALASHVYQKTMWRTAADAIMILGAQVGHVDLMDTGNVRIVNIHTGDQRIEAAQQWAAKVASRPRVLPGGSVPEILSAIASLEVPQTVVDMANSMLQRRRWPRKCARVPSMRS
ncbi:Serine-threonine protein kinase [Red seabream iridovirus]|uniref:Serine/threonine protein kinase catalytic domain n=4 Tax=Infectious spleen and kidney necrosis virus TaxID=180170 RepID=Q5YF74_ISKNV|nr:serine/threonine protein kinase catalytic domain [Rock bream iridovirus]AAX82324.1 serine/threonine protein kinases [Orange-spotted grouper iridovirus]AMM72758.1 serine/threonine protein kinase catalytic domain [giant sea perch iridovirus - K1]QIQ54578.1 serine/threonine protein kinase [Red seabream iridovirus]UZN72100.1 serine-threonine protein kinase [Large yellow croaker iridovirus]WBR81491.1 serine/threonine protein kinase catalytic domain-containing protein [Spotted knifejaw iridovirus